MAPVSSFQAMLLMLLAFLLHDAVGKSCRPKSSFSCRTDQVCCDHKCVYGSDCLGFLCTRDSDCSVGESCCSNKCKRGLNCVGSRCSENSDCGVYESCCFGTCSLSLDCKLYHTIEIVGIVCGATTLVCMVFVYIFCVYRRRNTEVHTTLNTVTNTSFVPQVYQAQPYHQSYLGNPPHQYRTPNPPPYSPGTTSASEHHPYSSARTEDTS